MNEIGLHSYCPSKITTHYSEYGNFIVGKYCSIGDNVQIFLGGNHRMDWISQHPITPIFGEPNKEGHPSTNGDVVIGNDVWIGSSAVIMSGVHVEDGAVIGAYSVVRRSIRPYEIHIGNPSFFMGLRFCNAEIEFLLQIKWWNWPIENIKEAKDILLSSNFAELKVYAQKNWEALGLNKCQ